MADSREWQIAYEAAVLEVDDTKLIEKANEAEAAIFHRLLALSGSPAHIEERKSLQNAITGLGILRNERLGHREQAKKTTAENGPQNEEAEATLSEGPGPHRGSPA